MEKIIDFIKDWFYDYSYYFGMFGGYLLILIGIIIMAHGLGL